jgi:antitoxin MazE
MKIKIVKIGNSKGIRIPRIFLRQTGIEEEVDLEVKNNQIILKPIDRPARLGWRTAFSKMSEHGDDKLIDEESLAAQSSFDDTDCDW